MATRNSTRSKPFLFVGDLHGEVGFFDKLLALYSESHRIVLMGDYLDSFRQPRVNQVVLVKKILHALETRKVYAALYGNHDYAYMTNGDRRYGCSGYYPITQILLNEYGLTQRMMENFTPFLLLEEGTNAPILATHAGLSLQVFRDFDLKLPSFADQLGDMFAFDGKMEGMVGGARGGWEKCGGPLWCDWQSEFTPIPGLIQIVGHSHSFSPRAIGEKDGEFQASSIRVLSNADDGLYQFNIDCLYPGLYQHPWYVLECDAGGTSVGSGGWRFNPIAIPMSIDETLRRYSLEDADEALAD